MKNNFKRYFQFLLIVLAAGSIYPLIYLRSNYQETILTVFSISPEQLNTIYSVIGLAFIIGYFPSGWLADKFSAKKLISLSLLICGLGGLWFAQIPRYNVVIVIFVIWGIFSVFTFWSAHLKMVKLIAKKEEEGRFFGILDGGRGVVEAVLATIALFIFMYLSGNVGDAGTKESLQGVIYMYSFGMLAMSVLVFLFVKERAASVEMAEVESKSKAPAIKLDKETLKKVFGNKSVWLMGLIIFMGYNVAWMIYYFGGFLQTNIGIDAIRVGQVMVISLWMRPIGGTIGGFLADKFSKAIILTFAFGLATIGLLALALIPTSLPQFFFEGIVIFICLMINTIRGIYWSLLGDCKIDKSVLGLSIGFISLLGYIPDFTTPIISTMLLMMFGSATGQNAFFIFGGSMGVLGIFLVIAFERLRKRELKWGT